MYRVHTVIQIYTVPFIKMLLLLDIFVFNGVRIGNRKDVALQKDRN